MRDHDVMVCEASPRDSLQMLSTFIPTTDKIAWISAEADAGVREIEVSSLVPPKVRPQFSDAAAAVEAAVQIPALTVTVLAPEPARSRARFPTPCPHA